MFRLVFVIRLTCYDLWYEYPFLSSYLIVVACVCLDGEDIFYLRAIVGSLKARGKSQARLTCSLVTPFYTQPSALRCFSSRANRSKAAEVNVIAPFLPTPAVVPRSRASAPMNDPYRQCPLRRRPPCPRQRSRYQPLKNYFLFRRDRGKKVATAPVRVRRRRIFPSCRRRRTELAAALARWLLQLTLPLRQLRRTGHGGRLEGRSYRHHRAT